MHNFFYTVSTGYFVSAALWCCGVIIGDNEYKMQSSFKTLVLKNAGHGGCTKPLGNDKFV